MRLTSTLVVSTALLVGACGDDEDTLWEDIEDENDLDTFGRAVVFASVDGDLVALLDGASPLTVFAPSDDAFVALAVELTGDPDAGGEDLLVPENKALLRDVLTYHLLGVELDSEEIPLGFPLDTLEGDVFKVEADEDVAVGDLVITDGRNRLTTFDTVDLESTNGVLHIVDRVLLPANLSIGQTVSSVATSSSPEFTILLQAAVAAGLVGSLSGTETFTVFAPTDAAFIALLSEAGTTLPELLANPQLLVDILGYHVVAGRVFEAQIPINTPIATVEGVTFQVDNQLGIIDARARRANIINTDTLATNGVIHVIDRVLLPR